MRIVIIGLGSIGQGLLPLLFKHFPDLDPRDVLAISNGSGDKEVADEYGILYDYFTIAEENFEFFMRLLPITPDILINVSVNVSSIALMQWCKDRGIMYLDTCIEPWDGGYQDLNIAKTTNYHLREEALKLRHPGAPTALIAHGANPGLVTYFVKKGLEELAKLRGIAFANDYAKLSATLGIRTIQIAERDTQDDGLSLMTGEFKNTWSVDGLISEAIDQPIELGWGTHERLLPKKSHKHTTGCKSAIFIDERGSNMHVKSWVPSFGEQRAMIITHHEAISIADFLTVKDGDNAKYRPTVYYAYHPTKQTWQSVDEMMFRGLPPVAKTIMNPVTGYDELGVLFVYEGGAYWYGSTLTVEEAKLLVPRNNATSLQVTATIIGALHWMIKNPRMGVLEAEDVDYEEILAVSLPYLGEVRGVETSWQPTKGGNNQFSDFLLKE